MKSKSDDDEYSPEEAKERMAAALRGARIAGHKPMTAIPKKRAVKKPVKKSKRD